MNVLFICGWYPNSRFIYEGIFVKKHAHAIKSVGANIRVLALTIGKSDKLYQQSTKYFVDEAGVETCLIEINSKFKKLLSVNLSLQKRLINKALKKHFTDFTPNIVHSNVLFPAGMHGHWLSKKLNVPHIMTEHWSKANAFLESGIYSKMAQKAINNAKVIMPVSKYLAEKLKKFVSPEKITVVPNTVDVSLYKFCERNNGDPNTLVFGALANWQNQKRPDLIFEALEKLSKQSAKKIVLHMAGGGDLIAPLQEKKWSFEVHYYGFIEPVEIIKIFKEVQFLLHASGEETFSIILAEAILQGIPVVASNVAAMPELVNEQNGILCENTVDAWVNAIKVITEKNYERKLMSEKMSQLVSYKSVGEKYLGVYERVMGN